MGAFCPKIPNERLPRLDELKNNPTALLVVAAAFAGTDGRLLLQRRPSGKHHAGLWEFPGGKVESTEIPRAALVREIAEELAIGLDPASLVPLAFADSAPEGDFPAIVILLYSVTHWDGEPRALEGGELAWFDVDEARKLPMPPLDVILLDNIARPSVPRGGLPSGGHLPMWPTPTRP